MNQRTGRPRVYSNLDGPLNINSVRLSDWHERQARKLGKGKISIGVRLALESTDTSGTYPAKAIKESFDDRTS